MTEEVKKRPQATFKRDVPVKVSFSRQSYTRRDHDDEPGEGEFHIVYMDLLDGTGRQDCGEAILSEGDFDVIIMAPRSVQPYAYQLLEAAKRRFGARNISVRYHD